MAEGKPNVILIITDDQGYGDLGRAGNPWLKTPNLDRFADEACRLNDFHVAPVCAPTRAGIMSGKRELRVGAWATAWGRSIMRASETTMADVFRAKGYRTGMFGKWHLGDNHPYRPFDRGFERVVAHKGGGVGHTPDFWGNNYFDDTYFHNGQPVSHDGYCTDVWFHEAKRFIEECGDEPFFCYLATNAPHGPYLVADEYKKPYEGIPEIFKPAFYGMIANIDENLGSLRRWLAERNLEDDTILIFMTDNGSAAGCDLDHEGFVTQGYNAGMRGKKGHFYDGGHRVPFFIRWPAGGVGARDVDEMTLGVDLLPTFMDLCGLDFPGEPDFDGVSLAPLIRGESDRLPGDRIHTTMFYQNPNPPDKWRNVVMTRQWRLVRGKELYDIQADPEQRDDISQKRPDVVQRLRDWYENYWDEVEADLATPDPIWLGAEEENPTRLDSMDLMGDIAWHQTAVAQAIRTSGQWAVKVTRPGTYRFALRRWPEELDLPIDDAISEEAARDLGNYDYRREGPLVGVMNPTRATLRIFDEKHESPVASGEKEAVFELSLKPGVTRLEARFIDDENGTDNAAYYVYVERLQ